MALENYNLYYRKFVIWKEQQLINPRLFDLSAFTFSKNSVLHYLGTPQDPFLLPNSPVLSSISNSLYTEVVTQYSPDRNLGKPRTLNRTITSTISSYYTKNMRIKHFDGINSIKGENDLIMYNYSMIDDGYNYNSQRGGEMMRWLNLYGTIFDNIAACAKQSTRMQVLFLDLPVTIPSPTLLEQTGKTGLIPSYYTRLNTHDHWLVTELWNLIMGRPQTLFVKFEDNLEWFNRLNLVFTHNGKYFILNLGFLLGLGKRHNGDFENLKVAKRLINLFLTTKEATAIVNLGDDDDDIEDSSKSDNELDYDRSDEEDVDITDIVKNAKVDDSPFDIRDPLAEMYNNNMSNEPAANKLPNMNLTDDSDLADDSESIDDDIDAKLAELEKVDDAKPLALDEDSYSVDDVYHEYVPPADDLDSAIETISQNYAKAGVLTSGEVNRMKKISQRYKTLPDPYGGNNNYKDYLNITQEELKITQDDNDVILGKDVKGVIDDSMTKSTLNKFDRQYIRTTLRKDLISSVMQLQKNGIAVADHKVERITNYMDDYEEHTVKLVPVVGSPSTVRFKVPVVKDDGTFKAKGVKYRLRKQKADLPIRKVAPNEVSLTSYYSKLFITRTERKQFDYTDWVTKNIIALSIGETPTVFGLSLNSVHDPNIKGLPRAYTAIASKVAQFTFGKMTFNFNIHRVDKFNKTGIDEYKGYVPVGKHGNKELLMKVSNNVIYELNGVKFDALGTIEQILGLGQPPLDLIEVSLFGKKVPLVIIIAYHLGLGNLLKTLKIKHQVHPRNVRTQVPEGWRQINFNDYKLFFDGSDYAKAMLINGFNRYKTLLASMNYYAFDKKDVYSGLIGEAGLPMSVLKEVPLLFNLWVDHITKDILIEMGEPTDLFNLFLRACELLTTDDHPDETDDAYMRIRGYERFSGLVYGEMIRAMRGYGSKAVIQNAKVELNPEAVWYSIMNDEAMIICEESNPIHELKEQEIIVFRGQGGRSSLSMTMKSRKYNKNGIGIISEATVDSGETGTITYLTANPNFKSVRGLGVITGDTNKVDPAQKQSTSMCLAPGSLTDD